MTKHSVPLLVILMCVWVSCGKSSPAPPAVAAPPPPDFVAAPPRPDPVILIGVDGLEWNLLLPLLRAGKLPAMAELIGRGSYGLLSTLEPTISPVIWTSVATGKLPSKHGILGFARPDGADSTQELFNNLDRTTKAIWNIAGDYERRAAVVGWWMTYPVEAINGVMVAQTNTAARFRTRENMPWKGLLKPGVKRQLHPPEREEEILGLLPGIQANLDEKLETTFGRFAHPFTKLEEQLWKKSSWSFRADVTYRTVSNRLLSDSEPYDLFLAYFGGVDVFGHHFWRFRTPELYELEMRPESIENFGSLIDDYYQYIDNAIGELVSRVGPDARVVIVSDHGMIPGYTEIQEIEDEIPVSGYHWEALSGVIIAAGPSIRDMPISAINVPQLVRGDIQRLCSILDITPTLLALMGLPIGEDMDGRVVKKLIKGEFLERFPVLTRTTHDNEVWLQARASTTSKPPDEIERLEQLASLGYLDLP